MMPFVYVSEVSELLCGKCISQVSSIIKFVCEVLNPPFFFKFQAEIKKTMEKAFWDGIMASMKLEQPDFSWVLKLMTEVRDELCEMSPESWRQEITGMIDIDILSQVVIFSSPWQHSHIFIYYRRFTLLVVF